jgi:hypothetical protein
MYAPDPPLPATTGKDLLLTALSQRSRNFLTPLGVVLFSQLVASVAETRSPSVDHGGASFNAIANQTFGSWG